MDAIYSDAPAARLRSQRKRVLIAEDDEELRWLLVSCFHDDGYRVEAVANGFALTDRILGVDARGLDLDLLVTDVQMPGISGLDVVSGLRRRSTSTDLPVILISAVADDETLASAAQLGAVLFEKPFDVDDLRTCAAVLLTRQGAHPPASGGESSPC